MVSDPNLDWLISVDDHILEPPNLWVDRVAAKDRDRAPHMECETDYPHSDSTWPNCITAAKKIIGHLRPETQYKLLRGNAEKLYRFTPAEPPVPARG